jgi:hypothetical protein
MIKGHYRFCAYHLSDACPCVCIDNDPAEVEKRRAADRLALDLFRAQPGTPLTDLLNKIVPPPDDPAERSLGPEHDTDFDVDRHEPEE